MNQSKWQRLLGAALVAALLTATFAPAAMAAVPAAAAQQVSAAKEITALLAGGQFTKIWLALTPDNPGTVTVTAEWDRANALENGVGFYILDENNQPIEFTPDNVRGVMRALPELLGRVVAASIDFDRFRESELKEAAKN